MTAGGSIRVASVDGGRGPLCRAVLDDLPEWFGLPAAKDAYVRAADDLPMLGAYDGTEPVGFASMKIHTDSAAELYVLGVLRSFTATAWVAR